MQILSLELKNFRNYNNASVEFSKGLNVLHGKNASGKTNMLESIYISSIFRSPRTTKDKELILMGENRAQIKIELEKRFRKHVILLQIDAAGKKKVAVDGIPMQRAGELLGVLGIVFFSPDEMKLVKESPAERRRFLDVGLSQQQKSYFAALTRYTKILKQKNNLLKDAYKISDIDSMLDVWDAQLAEYGAILIDKRREYLVTLNEHAAAIHRLMSDEKEELTLSYEYNHTETSDAREETTKDILKKAIEASREKDKALGFATVGPHRDDIKIEINKTDSRKFASQGQQRTIALAMKLGEAQIYLKEQGDSPVLLLDDVLSELDAGRQELLLKLTRGYQTIITCTEYELSASAKLFKIENGKVSDTFVNIKKQ